PFRLLSYLLSPPPPTLTLFPYTTLFRSSASRWSSDNRSILLRSPSACGCQVRRRRTPAYNSGLPASLHGLPYQHLRQTARVQGRSEEHTSQLQSRENLVCRLLLEKKKNY